MDALDASWRMDEHRFQQLETRFANGEHKALGTMPGWMVGGNLLTVQYRGRRPEEEAVCLTSFFAPFVFVTVRKTDKDVTFVEVPGR